MMCPQQKTGAGMLRPGRTSALWLCGLLAAVFLSVAAWAEEKKPPVVIGGIYAVTGPAAAMYLPHKDGARLATKEINQAGGVLGREFVLQLYDNKSTPIGSSLAVRQAHEDGVAAIVGPSWSSHALAAGKEAQRLQVPMCADVATNPAVTRVGDYVYRACFTDIFQGRVLAYFARQQLGLSLMASTVNLTSDYSIGLEALFRKFFTEQGGKVAKRAAYKDSFILRGQGLSGIVDQLAPFGMQAVFIPGHRESDVIVKELRKAGFDGPLLGGDGWETDLVNRMAGYEGEGAYYCSHWSPQWDTPQNKTFMQRHGKGKNITAGLVLAYDAVHLLANAIERAGSTEPEAVRKALAQTRDFKGVTGSITFDANGDPVKNAVIIQVLDGEPQYLQTISPSEVSF